MAELGLKLKWGDDFSDLQDDVRIIQNIVEKIEKDMEKFERRLRDLKEEHDTDTNIAMNCFHDIQVTLDEQSHRIENHRSEHSNAISTHRKDITTLFSRIRVSESRSDALGIDFQELSTQFLDVSNKFKQFSQDYKQRYNNSHSELEQYIKDMENFFTKGFTELVQRIEDLDMEMQCMQPLSIQPEQRRNSLETELVPQLTRHHDTDQSSGELVIGIPPEQHRNLHNSIMPGVFTTQLIPEGQLQHEDNRVRGPKLSRLNAFISRMFKLSAHDSLSFCGGYTEIMARVIHHCQYRRFWVVSVLIATVCLLLVMYNRRARSSPEGVIDDLRLHHALQYFPH